MIVFQHVYKVYDNKLTALSDINLTINDGDFVSIIGLSGAGKSTLLRTINKMHDIQRGSIYVDILEDSREPNPNYSQELREYEKKEEEAKALRKKLKALGEGAEAEKARARLLGLSSLDKPSKYSNLKKKRKVDVKTVRGKELRLLRRNIGMIFQSFNLVNRSSVYKNVLSGRVGYHNSFETLFSIYSKKEKMLALHSLDTLGILNKAYVRADKLSGGQQQRVALARALTQEPQIILADEPVASLDPVTTVAVMNDFKTINQKFGITIVANMHHVELAKKYSTRIIGIKAGRVVFDGRPEQVTPKVMREIYGDRIENTENEEAGGTR